MTPALAPLCTVPFCDSARARRVYFEMDIACDASFEYVIYVSTAAGYATKPTDTPRSQPFRGVLQSVNLQQSILGAGIEAFASFSGTMVIKNEDGYYDFLIRDYTIDARSIVIRTGRKGGSHNETFTVADVTATGWAIDADQVKLDLVDYAYKMKVPMQPNVYAGTGGKEGGEDLTNKRKPLGFGTPHEISPPLVDAALLIFQVNDGSVQAITAVYDQGIALASVRDYATYGAMAAANLSTDDGYVTCVAEGFFRLTDEPIKITCDIEGDNGDPDLGYVETSADIVRWAIRNRTEFTDPNDLHEPSFDRVNADEPGPIELWLGIDDSQTVADFATNIMGGLLGWIGLRMDRRIELRLFEPPAGVPIARVGRGDMLDGDIDRQELPTAYRPPPWRWRVPYQRAFTVQTLLTNISADRRAFLAQDVRLGGAENAAIKLDHPFATDPDPIQAYFKNKVDADAQGAKRIAVFKTTRALYRFAVDRRGLRWGLGDVIEVFHPRFDLSLGKLMTIVEIKKTIEYVEDKVEMVEVVAYG